MSCRAEIKAAATAKSAAGSEIRNPPAIFKYTSCPPKLMPQRDSKTANTMDNRLLSHPTTLRRGDANDDGATKAWTSTNNGRDPSIPAKTTDPGVCTSRSAKNNSDGFVTCANPAPVISNTPISSDGPNRFFTARKIRNWCPRSPSKYNTVSTICSTTRGPAI